MSSDSEVADLLKGAVGFRALGWLLCSPMIGSDLCVVSVKCSVSGCAACCCAQDCAVTKLRL